MLTATGIRTQDCTGGTECLSLTPGNHSVCASRTLWFDQKIPPIRREPMMNGFLSLNAWISYVPHIGYSVKAGGYRIVPIH